MRLPSMTTPEPNASTGEALPHGRATSGRRMVENTFTTALSASCAIAGLGSTAGFGAAPAVGSEAGGGSDGGLGGGAGGGERAGEQPQAECGAGRGPHGWRFLAGRNAPILTQKLKLSLTGRGSCVRGHRRGAQCAAERCGEALARRGDAVGPAAPDRVLRLC